MQSGRLNVSGDDTNDLTNDPFRNSHGFSNSKILTDSEILLASEAPYKKKRSF